MHLTNYAINKDNSNYIVNDDKESNDDGHKQTMTSIFSVIVHIKLIKNIK